MFSKSRLNVAVTQSNITTYILLTGALSEGAVVGRIYLNSILRNVFKISP